MLPTLARLASSLSSATSSFSIPSIHPSIQKIIALTTPLRSTPFKRSQNGLFHGKMKIYGNNVPFSKKKTRRHWLPNMQSKTFKSDALGKDLKIVVSSKALKTIRKYGGIDPYLLQTSSDLLGYEGIRLRILVREALEQQGQLSPQQSSSSPTGPGAIKLEAEEAAVAGSSALPA